ncbi:MAG: ribokinase [Opitutaceae bacterium]
MSSGRIVVVGSSNIDLVIRLDRLPRPGETWRGRDLITAPGGKGANQAVGAARAGGRVTFIARVGRDAFGDQAIAGFERDGIDITRVMRDPSAPTGTALILVDRNGRNMIAAASGANDRLTPADVNRARHAFAGAKIVLLQLESPSPTVEAAAALAAQRGARVILNPAPARPVTDRLLATISILTPNETEAELLTGIKVDTDKGAERAADRLFARGVGTVIITLGARGTFVAGDGVRMRVPGIRVRAVDTTAAGDIFNGAFAVGLAEGLPLIDAVHFANAAAAISVTRMGAQPSAPTRAEIRRMLGRKLGNRH